MFVAAETPVRLAFLATSEACGYFVLDRLIDLFFLLDLVKNFFSGFEEADGQMNQSDPTAGPTGTATGSVGKVGGS